MWSTEVDVVDEETSVDQFMEEAGLYNVRATLVDLHGPAGWPVVLLTAGARHNLERFLEDRWGDIDDVQFIEQTGDKQ